MIYLPPVTDFQMVALYDGGVPNKERILLKALQRANLAQYLLGVCWQSPNGLVTPLQDFFWLGDQVVEPPTMVFIYTGEGTQQVGQFPDKQPYITTHMGRGTTVFNRLELVPVLFRIDAMSIGKHFDSSLGKLVSIAESQVPKPQFQLPGTS